MYIREALDMVSVSPISSSFSSAWSYTKPVLSNETIGKLKDLGINISSVSSEREAKKIISEKTAAKEKAVKSHQTDDRFEKIYQRIKTLSMKIGVSVSTSEKIETVLNKIQARISMFEENNFDANIAAARSEYESIKYAYESITQAKSTLFTGLDILGKTNRAVMGITDIKK